MGKALAKIPRSLIVVIVLGLAFRLINLGQSFWLDEASQAQMSSWSVARIWSDRQGDFHPPFFYLLAHLWLQMGRSDIWLRTLPLIFGVLNIPAIYYFARRILPRNQIKFFRFSFSPEIVAAGFLALNPFHIYYSQEFRSYSLLSLLGTLSMYLLFTGRFISLAVVNTLLVYTHYSSVFLLLAQFTFVIFYKRTSLSAYLKSILVTALFYLPWTPQLAKQLSSGVNIDTYFPGWRTLLSVSTFKIVPLTFFKLVAGRINFLSWPVYLSYIIFVLGSVFVSFRFTRVHRSFLFNWVLVPLFAMIIFSLAFPQNQPFRVIYILPALILVFVQGCIRFPKVFITIFIYIFLVGSISYFTRPRLQREQWRQAIEFLQSESSSQTAVVVKFPDKFSPFYWYKPGLPVVAAVPAFPARPEQVSQILSPYLFTDISAVYVLDYLGELTDPNREVDQLLLDTGFSKDRIINFEGVGLIHRFSKNP